MTLELYKPLCFLIILSSHLMKPNCAVCVVFPCVIHAKISSKPHPHFMIWCHRIAVLVSLIVPKISKQLISMYRRVCGCFVFGVVLIHGFIEQLWTCLTSMSQLMCLSSRVLCSHQAQCLLIIFIWLSYLNI